MRMRLGDTIPPIPCFSVQRTMRVAMHFLNRAEVAYCYGLVAGLARGGFKVCCGAEDCFALVNIICEEKRGVRNMDGMNGLQPYSSAFPSSWASILFMKSPTC